MNIVPCLIISVGLALGDLQELLPLLEGKDWVPQLLFNALLFWEPFFIFGWLQSRFRNDFGRVPSIVLAGLGLAVYHHGSFPPEKILEFALTGIVFCAIYSIFRNIFLMFPIFWCVGATVGTIHGKMELDWSFVIFNLTVFLIPVGVIFVSLKIQKKSRGVVR